MPEYRNPTPTVDIIIEIGQSVVIIERGGPPFGYALPGGFIDEGECVEAAAIREAKEETNLDIELKELLYVYSNPKRDPRQHTMSVVFLATASSTPVAGDDAKNVELCPVDELLNREYAFDHKEILEDYLNYKKGNLKISPSSKHSLYT